MNFRIIEKHTVPFLTRLRFILFGLVLCSLATHTNASFTIDPQFSGFNFSDPLKSGSISNGNNCSGGIIGQPRCFQASGWYPYVQSAEPNTRGSVRRNTTLNAAKLTLPAGGQPLSDFVSLSQIFSLRSGTVYKVSIDLFTANDNTNPEPYVSTFCDRPERSLPDATAKLGAADVGTVYQGTDTIISTGNKQTIEFFASGDDQLWTCSVRLLGQPGATRNTRTSILVDKFSVTEVRKNVEPDPRAFASGFAFFELPSKDLADTPWTVTRAGSTGSSATIQYVDDSHQLVLSIPNAIDSTSVTVSRPLWLFQGTAYKLCASVTNLRGTRAVANLLISKNLNHPGNQGGFVLGPVDVVLKPHGKELFEVNFTAPYPDQRYKLVTRALGYGNNAAVSVAFDRVRVIPAKQAC